MKNSLLFNSPTLLGSRRCTLTAHSCSCAIAAFYPSSLHRNPHLSFWHFQCLSDHTAVSPRLLHYQQQTVCTIKSIYTYKHWLSFVTSNCILGGIKNTLGRSTMRSHPFSCGSAAETLPRDTRFTTPYFLSADFPQGSPWKCHLKIFHGSNWPAWYWSREMNLPS